jgi:hypothetical protein
MIIAPYKPNRLYDEMLSSIIRVVKDKLKFNDDDFFILCVGDTGTGKSNLMLHAYEEFDSVDCSVDYISLTRDSFAHATKAVKDKQGLRFLGNDEANLSKRDSLSQYNKDVLDLYFSVRGLNIFHWWNNPSVEMIDKAFIKERIKGMIMVTTKDKDKPRIYYYFRKDEMLKIYEKYGNLDLKTIRKVKKKYAFYRGWVKKYTGKMLKPYLEKKGERMNNKVDLFYEKWGNSDKFNFSAKQVYEKVGISQMTFNRYMNNPEINNRFEEGKDYCITSTGKKKYSSEILDKFEDIKKIKIEQRKEFFDELHKNN